MLLAFGVNLCKMNSCIRLLIMRSVEQLIFEEKSSGVMFAGVLLPRGG
jgi:hypothetical protein